MSYKSVLFKSWTITGGAPNSCANKMANWRRRFIDYFGFNRLIYHVLKKKPVSHFMLTYTIECRYNTGHHTTIIHTSLQWPRQIFNQRLHSQNMPHIWPSHTSYGVPIVSILEKIDLVKTAPVLVYVLKDNDFKCVWIYHIIYNFNVYICTLWIWCNTNVYFLLTKAKYFLVLNLL